jgi:hypothetical protein
MGVADVANVANVANVADMIATAMAENRSKRKA